VTLDKTITELADKMIELQLEERRELLKGEIRKLDDEFRAAGQWKSSRLVLLVKQLCNREIITRTQIVWQSLLKVLSAQSIVPAEGLGDELKERLQRYSELIVSEPLEELRKIANRIAPTVFAVDLAEGWELARKKVFADIDYFILSIEGRRERKEGQTVFNFHGSHIGTLQTGPGASAITIHMLNKHDRDTLTNALNHAKQDLLGLEKLPGYDKNEVIDLIERGQAELNKPKPNSMWLRSTLSGIATAIQTAASLQPAYQMLKTALLPLGIFLP
jgi:hypothetical protein